MSRTAEHQRAPFTLLLWTVGAVTVILGVTPAVPYRSAVFDALVLIAPVIAAAACWGAVRALPRGTSPPWLVFSAAAVFCTIAHLWGYAASSPSMTIVPHVTAMSLVALGIGWKLHIRDHGRLHEIALDAALIVATATIITLRWAPSAQDTFAATSTPEMIGAFGAPIATGVAFLFASVLLVLRGPHLAVVARALFVATAAFGLAAAPFALGTGGCCGAGDAASAAFVLGWLGIAFAAVAALRSASAGELAVPEGHRMRMVVAPTVAIAMGALVVDTIWRGPLQQRTVIAFGIAGFLLAARVSQLLFATRSQSVERQQLAQSRALIEVSRALSGTTRLDETLALVTQWAVRLLDARAASIELLSADGRKLRTSATFGVRPGPLHMEFPVEGSFTGRVVLYGQARSTDNAQSDPDVHESSRPWLGRSPLAAAPLTYRGSTVGALACVGRYPFTSNDLELLRALADQAAIAIENARLFEQVHQLSLTDPLTGLANRRQLEKDLAREFAAARRGRPLLAVMFDLNGFKEYNDRWGHVAGDYALKSFATALAIETRAMNAAARYGGDEFIALLADADEAGAGIFIDRVRARFPGADASTQMRELSVAAGFACYDPAMKSPEELVTAADRALYHEKAGARRSA